MTVQSQTSPKALSEPETERVTGGAPERIEDWILCAGDREELGGEFNLWETLRTQAVQHAEQEPLLGSFLHATILNHDSFTSALSFMLAEKLATTVVPGLLIREVIDDALSHAPSICRAAQIDVVATFNRDPACPDHMTPFLFYKGYHALQGYRISHWLWQQGRETLARFLQNQISGSLGVDIHPAARIGCGIMLDHATGIVVGETAVIEDDVSILHSVTLGGTGKDSGDRHPKIRKGVLLAAGSKIIGNIIVGEHAKVGAGSVVLKDVPANVTVAGVPAEIVAQGSTTVPAFEMDQTLNGEIR